MPDRVIAIETVARHRRRRHRPEVGWEGYDVFLVAGSAVDIDLTSPARRLGAVLSVELTGLQPSTRYAAGVAARSRFGLLSSLQTLSFDTDEAGDPQLAPAAPQELTARALAGGDVELTWLDPADGPMPAAYFLLHWDAGSGKVDYSESFDSVAASGSRQRYRHAYSPGVEGRLRYSVRAYSAADVPEQNTVVAECIADATGPPAMTQAPILTQL